jgi:hypothetical protein
MVRVNLLPPEIANRARQRRAVRLTIAALVLYAVLLGLVYYARLQQVNDARVQRDADAAEVTRLQTELAALAPYRELVDERQERDAALAQAMAEEVSLARVLNEVALQFPANSSLTALSVDLRVPEVPVAPAPAPAPTPADPAAPVTADAAAPVTIAPVTGEQPIIGLVTYAGYTVDRYAPGIEGLLQSVDRVPAFVDTFVTAAQIEVLGEGEVTSFSGTSDIDANAYTRRYEEGLPEVPR